MLCGRLDALKTYLESQDRELLVRNQYFSFKKAEPVRMDNGESFSTGSNSDEGAQDKDIKSEGRLLEQEMDLQQVPAETT